MAFPVAIILSVCGALYGATAVLAEEGRAVAAGSFLEDRGGYSATALPDGRVLVVGGIRFDGESSHRLASAEVWDPQLLAFEEAGEMAKPRVNHMAALQPDGRVLVVGGTGRWSRTEDAELWDPRTSTFSPAAPMVHPRGLGATLTMLPGGRVLIIGGASQDEAKKGQEHRAESWNPATGSFEAAGRLPRRPDSPQVLPLRGGDALLIGRPSQDWLRWDSKRRRFEPVARPAVPRDWVVGLTGGRVLAVGVPRDRSLGDTEVWLPGSGQFRLGGSFITPRNVEDITPLPDGGALFYGGHAALGTDTTIFPTAEYWDPRSRTFSRAGRTTFGREWYTATPLPDGRVVFIGGLLQRRPDRDTKATDSIVIWDPDTRSFQQAGRLREPRAFHQAVPLADGAILVLGGEGRRNQAVTSAELWRPHPAD